MAEQARDLGREADLRERALSRLTVRGSSQSPHASHSEALAVLYEMASSPDSAPNALALLHELQVHQVELDLQDEELRDALRDLEAALHRQQLIYDLLPVACFTVDASLVMYEMNRAGALLIGREREALLGAPLASFLELAAVQTLRSLLTDAADGKRDRPRALRMAAPDGSCRQILASAARSPDGQQFLIALMTTGEAK